MQTTTDKRRSRDDNFIVRPNRRPIVGLALAFALGVWLQHLANIPYIPLLAASWLSLFTVLATATLRTHRPTGKPSTDVTTTLLVLLSAATLSAASSPAQPLLLALPTDFHDNVVINGTITTDPENVVRGTGPVYIRFDCLANAISTGADTVGSSGTLRVFWRPSHWIQPPVYGERWLLGGRLAPPLPKTQNRPARNPTLFAQPHLSRRLDAAPQFTLFGALYQARNRAAEMLRVGVADFPQETGIVQALLLGYRGSMAEDIVQLFANTGTLHIFAISGLHVVILCSMVLIVFKALHVPRTRWVLVATPILMAYILATGMEASACRACVMALICLAAPALYRVPDVTSALGGAAIVILAAVPEQLFEIGFILSFVAVIGLLVFMPPIDVAIRRALAPNSLAVQQEPRRLRLARVAARHLLNLAAISLVSWAVSTPLIAYFFQRVSLSSVATNMLIVPLSFAVMTAGALALVGGACATILADIFNHANLGLVKLMLWIVDLAARIPGGSLETSIPSLPWIAAWYLTLIVAAWRLRTAFPAVTPEPSLIYDIDN